MGKKAVLIGCNYPGTKAELKGCINDVNRMYNCLVDRYGFKPDHITVLIDTDSAFMQPTGVNIRRALRKLVGSAKPGDYLFVHYSGHGTRLPAETGEDDDTGFDECIVPTDMNLITDEDFKELVCQVRDGCTITIVSDSCHSGGLISGLKEQIGESTTQPQQKEHHFSLSGFLKQTVKETVKEKFESRGIQIPSSSHHHQQQHSENEYRVFEHDDYHHNWGYVQNKSLPLSTLIELLKEKTGKDDIDVGKIRPTLFDIFGDDASPKVKKFMKVILNKLRGGGKEGSESGGGLLSAVGGLALEFIKQKLEENDEEEYAKPAMDVEVESTKEVYAGSRKKTLPRNGILLSGCQSNQTSADASPAGNNADAYGAFSNAIQFILKETDGRVSNEDIVLKARGKLKKKGLLKGLGCIAQMRLLTLHLFVE